MVTKLVAKSSADFERLLATIPPEEREPLPDRLERLEGKVDLLMQDLKPLLSKIIAA
jgi:hypothetical protein